MTVEAATEAPEPLYLKFLGALVEELGRRMYPSATATIAELISNAWDADAENVWVNVPFATPWTAESAIVVTDDGNGMTREDAAKRYLHVGGKRRVGGNDESDVKHRKVHGRKGIGKLAAFGTADSLEVVTKSSTGEITGFLLDYDAIRTAAPGGNVLAQEISTPASPANAQGVDLDHGTRVKLSGIRLTQQLNEDRFFRSMSRRFALSSTEMRIFINQKELTRFEIDTRFRFPPDGHPDDTKIEESYIVEDWAGARQVVDGIHQRSN